MADVVLDKLSFIGKLTLLSKATSDDADPTPGYMYHEINNVSLESGLYCEDLVDWLVDRLGKKSSHVKLKVLRIMKHVVTNGHPQFRQSLRKKSQRIAEAAKHSGPPDPLHGNALYATVRQEAKDLSSTLFTTTDDDCHVPTTSPGFTSTASNCGLGSTGNGNLRGFGNTVQPASKSLGDTILGSLQSLAERVVDMSVYGVSRTNATSKTTPQDNSTGYTPVFVPPYKPAGSHPDFCVDTAKEPLKQATSPAGVSRVLTEHKRGVAGGGWEDDDNDSLVKSDTVTQQSVKGSSASNQSTNSARNADAGLLEDWSAETRLVNDLTYGADEPLLKRQELRNFVASCSSVSCDKVVEFLSGTLDIMKTAPTMRSLLAVETLLRTDLVTADFIAVSCHQSLQLLYTSPSADECVQQKARKLIRILEKLAPEQAQLFSGVALGIEAVHNSHCLDRHQSQDGTSNTAVEVEDQLTTVSVQNLSDHVDVSNESELSTVTPSASVLQSEDNV